MAGHAAILLRQFSTGVCHGGRCSHTETEQGSDADGSDNFFMINFLPS